MAEIITPSFFKNHLNTALKATVSKIEICPFVVCSRTLFYGFKVEIRSLF